MKKAAVLIMIIATVVLIQISYGNVVYADTSPSYSIITYMEPTYN